MTQRPKVENPKQFMDVVLTMMYRMMRNVERNNYDYACPPIGSVSETSFAADLHKEYLKMFIDNYERMFATYAVFRDDFSRDLYLRLILFNLLGHSHVRLPMDTDTFWNARRACNQLPSVPSIFSSGGNVPVEHFAIPISGGTINIDCFRINIFYSFCLKQYFLNRDGVRIGPDAGDHVIDAGACFGDTAVVMALAVGPHGRIYSFDPIADHAALVRHNIAQNPAIRNVALFPVALGAENAGGNEDHRPKGIDVGFSVAANPGVVPTRALDDLVADGAIPRVDFIKMDIEGFELEALRGAEETIRKFRPKLAISLYHKKEDLFTIPEYIRNLDVGYSVYLENYSISTWETVLYATAA